MKIKLKRWKRKRFAKKHGKNPTPFPALNEIFKTWDELFRGKKNDEKKQSNGGPDISAWEKGH